MFNNISWQNYWTALAVISAAYYVAVYLLFFRSKFSFRILKGRKIVFNNNNADEAGFDSCLDELGAFYDAAKGRKWAKEELAYSLEKFFAKYKALHSSDEDTIRRIIILQSKDICSVHFSEAEVSQLFRLK